MLYRTLDLLACPNCKHSPLNLIVIEEEERSRELAKEPKPLCTFYCSYLKEEIKDGKEYPCDECIKKEVNLGILVCPNCGMWYPISNGIPVMFASKKEREKAIGRFLQQYGDRIPKDVWDKIKSYKENVLT
ncbi:MAG: hypothetical protein GSR79_06150 [Desulfurococcales archaeon]|nr:hypothetical protein [Desulfurococcales archaeon]